MTTTTSPAVENAIRVDEAKMLAGYRHAAVTRTTGTLVVLLAVSEMADEDLAGLDDETAKWVTLCQDHGEMATFQAQKPAQRELHHPEVWCGRCRDGEQAEPQPTTPEQLRVVKVDGRDLPWTLQDPTGQVWHAFATRSEAREAKKNL